MRGVHIIEWKAIATFFHLVTASWNIDKRRGKKFRKHEQFVSDKEKRDH